MIYHKIIKNSSLVQEVRQLYNGQTLPRRQDTEGSGYHGKAKLATVDE